MGEILVTLGLMVIAASVCALFARQLRQPLIIGYVVAGVLLGPTVTGLVSDWEPLVWLSELALIFLLFVIGLELDLSKVKDVGKASVFIGVCQVVLVGLISGFSALLFGFSSLQAMYLGLVVALSSTILVVKLLDDRKESASTVGELTLGILITQDILAVLALSLLGTFKSSATAFPSIAVFGLKLWHPLLSTGVTILINGFMFVAITFLFFKYVMPLIFKKAISSHELLFISSIAVVFFISALAGFFQFSLAIGSFAAGVALSSVAYSHEVVGRVKPLKDFFLILFFVGMGMQVSFTDLGNPWLLGGFLFVMGVIVKPLVTFVLLKMFDYNNYTSFLTSIHLAQLGEFGLILIASGVFSGVLTVNMLTIVVITTIITMMISTYFIEYDQETYHFFRPIIDPWDKIFGTHPGEVRNVPERYKPEMVIFGITAVTSDIIDRMKNKKKLLVVDYNPARAIIYREQGIPTICSDAIDIDLYESIDFSEADIVISVIHDTADTLYGPSSNTFLIKKIRGVNKKAVIIVTAHNQDRGEKFYKAGANIVLTPGIMGKRILKELLNVKGLDKLRGLGLIYYKELHREVPFTEA